MGKFVGYVYQAGTGEVVAATKAFHTADAAWYSVASLRMKLYDNDGSLQLEIDVEPEEVN